MKKEEDLDDSDEEGTLGELEEAPEVISNNSPLKRAMTTIEKKFESIDLDISRKNFQDLFDEFKKRRDLSVEQIRDMWESQGNEPLQPG